MYACYFLPVSAHVCGMTLRRPLMKKRRKKKAVRTVTSHQIAGGPIIVGFVLPKVLRATRGKPNKNSCTLRGSQNGFGVVAHIFGNQKIIAKLQASRQEAICQFALMEVHMDEGYSFYEIHLHLTHPQQPTHRFYVHCKPSRFGKQKIFATPRMHETAIVIRTM